MKITKKQLKQIIKEEIGKALKEVSPFQRRYGKEQFSDPHFVEKGIQKQPTPPAGKDPEAQDPPPAGKDPNAQVLYKALKDTLGEKDKLAYQSSKGPIVSGIDYIGVYGGQDVIPEINKKVDDSLPGVLVVFMQSEINNLYKAVPQHAFQELRNKGKISIIAG